MRIVLNSVEYVLYLRCKYLQVTIMEKLLGYTLGYHRFVTDYELKGTVMNLACFFVEMWVPLNNLMYSLFNKDIFSVTYKE